MNVLHTNHLQQRLCDEQLNLRQVTYMQYCSLLSPIQLQLLLAIAEEGLATESQARDFSRKHKIDAASSAQKALNALLDKEMIFAVETAMKLTTNLANLTNIYLNCFYPFRVVCVVRS